MGQEAWAAWQEASEEGRRQLLRETATLDGRPYVSFLRQEMSSLPASLCQEVAIFLSSLHYELESQLLQLEEGGQEGSQAYQDLLAFYQESGFLSGLEDADEEN